jgi:hypothetical protein
MKPAQTSDLLVELSTTDAQAVQGGCHRHSSFRPTYYSYRPVRSVYSPSFSYGYGFSGYGGGWSGGSVNQAVNVNIRIDD